MNDRRALFFLVFAGLCFAVAPVGLAEHRSIAFVLGATYLVLALLSFLDARSRGTRRR